MVVIFVMLLNSDVVVLRILIVVILLFLVIVWEYDVIMLLKNFFIELILIWVGFVGGIIWGIKLFWKWSICEWNLFWIILFCIFDFKKFI